jgi:citronellol/citronellal dehydrogenase
MNPTRTPKMEPRVWGISPEKLAEISTVFRSNLFQGTRFVVSGGGSGIGRAIAFLVARLGADVLICGRDHAKLAAAADACRRHAGRELHVSALTIRDPDQVDDFAAKAVEHLGGVDVLVNCAGGQFPQNALDFSPKGWRAVIDTNLNGTWWMMQAFARRWRDHAVGGNVINIVAVYDRGIPQSAHTAAARAGVVFLSKSVAVEWAPLGIRVNCLAPGTIETEGLNNYPHALLGRMGKGNPMRRMGSTWEVAEAVAYLASPASSFVTGEVLHVDGGMQIWGTNWPLGVPEAFRDA